MNYICSQRQIHFSGIFEIKTTCRKFYLFLDFWASTDREAILTSRMGLGPERLRALREPSSMLKASLDLHPRRAESLWDSQARFLRSLLTLGGLEWLESLCLGRCWCQGLLLFRLVG